MPCPCYRIVTRNNPANEYLASYITPGLDAFSSTNTTTQLTQILQLHVDIMWCAKDIPPCQATSERQFLCMLFMVRVRHSFPVIQGSTVLTNCYHKLWP